MADGSCEYAQEGYDCNGNINVQIYDEALAEYVPCWWNRVRGLVAGKKIWSYDFEWCYTYNRYYNVLDWRLPNLEELTLCMIQ